jgi:hypothetical protein
MSALANRADYRWTNFDHTPRRRRALHSAAEGTQAATGVVVHPGQNPLPAARAAGQRLRGPQRTRPYQPRPHGPVVRTVPMGTPPPTCIHCAGPMESNASFTSAVHIQRREQRWICLDTQCWGRSDAVVYKTPMDEYERRC